MSTIPNQQTSIHSKLLKRFPASALKRQNINNPLQWDGKNATPVEHILSSSASKFKKQEALRELVRLEADLFTYAEPKTLDEMEVTKRQQEPHNRQLLLAARAGNLEKLQEAIDKGADVNAPDGLGDIPLLKAAEYGNTRCVQALINAKAKLNQGEKHHGYTALHYAAMRGDYLTAQLLIDAGAPVNETDYFGDTPLNRALSAQGMFDVTDNKYRETVRALKKAGAQVSALQAADNLLLGFLNKTLSMVQGE